MSGIGETDMIFWEWFRNFRWAGYFIQTVIDGEVTYALVDAVAFPAWIIPEVLEGFAGLTALTGAGAIAVGVVGAVAAIGVGLYEIFDDDDEYQSYSSGYGGYYSYSSGYDEYFSYSKRAIQSTPARPTKRPHVNCRSNNMGHIITKLCAVSTPTVPTTIQASTTAPTTFDRQPMVNHPAAAGSGAVMYRRSDDMNLQPAFMAFNTTGFQDQDIERLHGVSMRMHDVNDVIFTGKDFEGPGNVTLYKGTSSAAFAEGDLSFFVPGLDLPARGRFVIVDQDFGVDERISNDFGKLIASVGARPTRLSVDEVVTSLFPDAKTERAE